MAQMAWCFLVTAYPDEEHDWIVSSCSSSQKANSIIGHSCHPHLSCASQPILQRNSTSVGWWRQYHEVHAQGFEPDLVFNAGDEKALKSGTAR